MAHRVIEPLPDDAAHPSDLLLRTVEATARPAGLALGAALDALGAARRSKPLHPQGCVLSATFHLHGGARPTGVPLLDEPGQRSGIARVSRSVGLPPALPDIQGIALRWTEDGALSDLLLASTGLGRLGRFVLAPRRQLAGGALTTLLPYRGPRGAVLIAAVARPGRYLPADPAELRTELTRDPLVLRLAHAAVGGPWWPFGYLKISGGPGPIDMGLRFDPVLNPVPGLQIPRWAARLREPAYTAARRHPA